MNSVAVEAFGDDDFSELIGEVRETQKSVLLTKEGKPYMRIDPEPLEVPRTGDTVEAKSIVFGSGMTSLE